MMMIAKPMVIPRRRFLSCLPVAVCGLAWFAWRTPGRAMVVAAGPVTRIACVGDSITYGSHLKKRSQESYPAVLGRLMDAEFDVRNFGVSGATLLKKGDKPYFKQKEYADALAFKPDVVVIMLGTNDSKHPDADSLHSEKSVNNWQYKADYVPDYEDLIGQFRKANPNVKVYVCLPTPCFPGSWGINGGTIQKEIIPLIRQVAADTQSDIIDLNAALAGKKDLFPDTVHPNAQGAKLMAFAVYHALTGKDASVMAR